MWSMWNAPSDRDYFDPLGLDCDADEPEICEDCGARWDRGEACEDCLRNESAHVGAGTDQLLAVEEQGVDFFEGPRNI